MKKTKRFLAFFLIIVYVHLIGDPYVIVNACSVTGTTPSITINGVRWHADTKYDDSRVYLTLCEIETSEDDIELRFPTFKECYDKWSTLGSGYVVSGNIKKVDRLRFCYLNDSLERVKSLVINEGYKVFPNDLEYDYQYTDMFQDNTSIENIVVNTNDSEDFEIREATFANMSGLEDVNMNVGTRNLVLDGSVFANCPNLKTVTLTGNVTLGGSFNFVGCKKLQSIVINGTLVVDGTQDFSGCENLESIEVSGNTTFNGANTFTNTTAKNSSLEAKFNGTSFITSSSLLDGSNCVAQTSTVAKNLLQSGAVSEKVSGTKAVFAGCENISMISINAKGNMVDANFISNSTIANLNIEGGTTTLADGAITGSHIDGMSFNATTRVGQGALDKCTVENMYFNTSDVKSSGNAGAIGKNGTNVKNMYFNHYDFSRNSNKVTSLENVPLGTGDYSLNCENIFFLSPNFNQINQSPYDNSREEATKVYGYGGTLSSYDSIKNITAKEMFEQWTAGSNSTYHNIVQLTGGQEQGVTETKRLFVEEEDQKAVFDLSGLEILAKYNGDLTNLDQLPTDEDGNVRQGEFRMQYTKDPNAGTNFNYKVLTKATGEAASGQYAYTDKDGNKYITCQEDKLELGVGQYDYYVQAAGEIWPLKVVVEQNKVTDLKVSIEDNSQKDGKIHLTVGDELTKVKKYIKVTAVLADQKTEVLDASQYTVVKTNLSTTSVTAQDTTLLVYHEESRKSVELKDVQVHEKKLASFHVACDKANMPIGSQLTLDNVTLTNGVYENPLDTPIAKINKGYHFLQDGQETDVYTIKSGENKISVTYEGCVEEIAVTGVSNQVKDYEINCNVKEVELYQKSSLDISEVTLEDVVYADERLDGFKVEAVKSGFTFVVNGEETDTVKLEDGENTIRVRYNGLDKKFTVKAYAQSVDRIEVSYCGPAVYEGNEVPKDNSVLLVTVYYKHPYEVSVLLSNFEVSYDTYHIVPGEDNEIYVNYKGVKSSNPIHVQGLEDGLKEIKKVEYRGSKNSGTSLKKDDFYVELGYLSGKTVTSEENPAILDKLTFSSDKLTEGENCIKVVYDGALTGEVNVVTNGFDVTETPMVTITPSDVPKGTDAIQDPSETISPVFTITPSDMPKGTDATQDSSETISPVFTIAPGDVPEVPVATQDPLETDSPVVTPTASPLTQPQKGNSFIVQGVKYKVTGVTKKGGSVSVTGYDKKASKVKMQTAVSFNGYRYEVTKIEKGAFKNCSKLSGTLSLTKNVKVVGDSAFYGCKNIKAVVFGSNVTQIGKNGFYNCSKLSIIQFKTGSVKKIGKNAFKGIAKKYTVKTTKALKKTYAKRLKGAI